MPPFAWKGPRSRRFLIFRWIAVTKYLLLCSILLLAFIAGCSPTGDSLMQENIALINDWATALESGAPEARSKEFEARAKALQDKQLALKLTDAERKALIDKYSPELTKAMTRLTQAMFKGAMNRAGGNVQFPGFPPTK